MAPLLKLEIVSHCWNYARLLTYQLSSFVLYPPQNLSLVMTVFYSDEDDRTVEALRYFGQQEVPGVTWNWQNLSPGELFQRPIGRNMAALATEADWVWFTDCDQVFHEGCLDSLPDQLADSHEDLVYPKFAQRSEHLDSEDEIFGTLDQTPRLLEIDPDGFSPTLHTKAIGGMQIVRGDVARKVGYCRDMPKYMKPLRRFRRDLGDVTFRRILGTEGTPIDVPNFFRIEHKAKGRRRFKMAKL